MRPQIILLAVVGLGAASLGYVAAGNHILSSASIETNELPLEVPAMDEMDFALTAPEEPELPEPLVRPVAPDIIGAPVIEPGRFERIEEREPLSPMGRATDPRDLPPAPTALHRPVVTAAGAFEAQGHKVVLAGIDVTSADLQCGEAGRQWPCGVHARTAFRNWLRGRAPSCVVTPVPLQETVVSDCTLGGQNPAEWLVSQGWVRATADGPYAELGAQAERERRGLFGPAPDVSVNDPVPALPQMEPVSGD